MPISIRELGLADEMMVTELLDRFERDWSDDMAPGASGALAFVAEPSTFMFGAYDDHEPAGWLWGTNMRRPDGRIMTYVHQITVDPELRRRGIATLLMQAALEHARRTGAHRLWLVTDTVNDRARALYERLGAQQIVEQGNVVYAWPLE